MNSTSTSFPVIDDESGVLESDLAPGLDGKPEVFRHRARHEVGDRLSTVHPSEMIVAPWNIRMYIMQRNIQVFFQSDGPGDGLDRPAQRAEGRKGTAMMGTIAKERRCPHGNLRASLRVRGRVPPPVDTGLIVEAVPIDLGANLGGWPCTFDQNRRDRSRLCSARISGGERVQPAEPRCSRIRLQRQWQCGGPFRRAGGSCAQAKAMLRYTKTNCLDDLCAIAINPKIDEGD